MEFAVFLHCKTMSRRLQTLHTSFRKRGKSLPDHIQRPDLTPDNTKSKKKKSLCTQLKHKHEECTISWDLSSLATTWTQIYFSTTLSSNVSDFWCALNFLLQLAAMIRDSCQNSISISLFFQLLYSPLPSVCLHHQGLRQQRK